MDTTVLSLGVAFMDTPAETLSPDKLSSLAGRMDAEVTFESPTELTIEQERLSFSVPVGVERSYPAHRDIGRLAEAAQVWLELCTDTPTSRSVVYAISRTYSLSRDIEDSSEAILALGKKLFAPSLPFSDWQVVGGFASIFCQDNQGREWNFTTGPRTPNSTRLFLGVSLHTTPDSNLSIEEMARSLRDVWKTSLRFLQEVVDA